MNDVNQRSLYQPRVPSPAGMLLKRGFVTSQRGASNIGCSATSGSYTIRLIYEIQVMDADG